MSRNLWLFLLVAFIVTYSSNALQCFKCRDCDNKATSNSTCLPGIHKCLKANIHGKVRKLCAPSAACKLESVDRKSLNPLKNLKLIFSDDEWKKIVGEKRNVLHCCDTDFCNGSPDKKTSPGLLFLLPIALYYLAC